MGGGGGGGGGGSNKGVGSYSLVLNIFRTGFFKGGGGNNFPRGDKWENTKHVNNSGLS